MIRVLGIACFAAIGCGTAYEPPVVVLLDDGGVADVSVQIEAMADHDARDPVQEADAPASPDIRTLVPEVGPDGEAEVSTQLDAMPDALDGAIESSECGATVPVEAGSPLTWTVGSDPTCSATSPPHCPDTMNPVMGTYAIRADGTCPSTSPCLQPSNLILWFPGNSIPAPNGYDIYPVSTASEVHDIPAMKVVLRIEAVRAVVDRWWAQSGSVLVSTRGGQPILQFVNVQAREERTGSMTTLAGELACP